MAAPRLEPEDADLRDPNEFDDADFEEHASHAPQGVAANSTLRSSVFHRRSGTGTNMSVNSISTKKTMVGIARRTLGLCLMLVTITMWTASNFLASSIFANDTYSKPFFVTWLNVGMFSVFLISPLTRRALQRAGVRIPWSRQRAAAPVYAPVATTEDIEQPKAANNAEHDDEDHLDVPSSSLSSTQSSRESLVLDESMVLSTHGYAPSPSTTTTSKLNLRETALLSLQFSSLWFLSNYFVSACLQYTTVASSTVLGSTSSIFTLFFGSLLGAERFTIRKLLSVGVCLLGVILISQSDLSGSSDKNRGSFPEKSTSEMAIGDVLALAGALGYGLYTIVLKLRVHDESRIDVFLFFGFIGLWDLLLFWPMIPIMHWTGIETFEAPPSANVWWVIVANGLISVVSDVCWTYSMLLTSPLVITVGLSLAIPMSLLGQMVINGQSSSGLYWVGSVVVAVSFFIVNQESAKEAEAEDRAIIGEAGRARVVVGGEESERGADAV